MSHEFPNTAFPSENPVVIPDPKENTSCTFSLTAKSTAIPLCCWGTTTTTSIRRSFELPVSEGHQPNMAQAESRETWRSSNATPLDMMAAAAAAGGAILRQGQGMVLVFFESRRKLLLFFFLLARPQMVGIYFYIFNLGKAAKFLTSRALQFSFSFDEMCREEFVRAIFHCSLKKHAKILMKFPETERSRALFQDTTRPSFYGFLWFSPQSRAKFRHTFPENRRGGRREDDESCVIS